MSVVTDGDTVAGTGRRGVDGVGSAHAREGHRDHRDLGRRVARSPEGSPGWSRDGDARRQLGHRRCSVWSKTWSSRSGS